MFDGTDVCDECWLDVAMDRQAMHWKESRAAVASMPSYVRPVANYPYPVESFLSAPPAPAPIGRQVG